MQTMSNPPNVPSGDELNNEVRHLLRDGLVIWSKAEATVYDQDGGESVMSVDDGFLGLAHNGMELRVFRVRIEGGKIGYHVNVSSNGCRTSLVDEELNEVVFNKAAEKAQ